jgi:hypothetical protein
VLHEGRERRGKIRRHIFILPPNLREDPAFAIGSLNRRSFVAWEFDPRRRAGYLDDMSFFNQDVGVVLDNDDADKGGDHDEEPVDNVRVAAQPVNVNP